MSEWKPIETAPKDGMVLVAGFWDDGRSWRDIGHCDHLGVVGRWDYNLEPTHWMPLPEPPDEFITIPRLD